MRYRCLGRSALTIGSVMSLSVLLVVPAFAAPLQFEATLDGLQEVPPNASVATGFGTFVVDTTANTMDFNITYSGLMGTETGAHIHGAGGAGVNAGVLFPLPFGTPKVGQWVFTEAEQAYILAGLTYVNIHTTLFPGGEIRGQILRTDEVPVEPATWSQIKMLYRD